MALLMLGLLALGAFWLSWQRPTGEPIFAASVPAAGSAFGAASSALAVPAGHAEDADSAASIAALMQEAREAAKAAQDREAAAERQAQALALIEKQWCTHAKLAHTQSLRTIHAALPRDGSDGGRDAFVKALTELPTQRAMYEAQRRVKAEWARQLLAMPDPRSQGIGLFFQIDVSLLPEKRQPLEQRLQTLALAGSDPLVLSLWRRRSALCPPRNPCEPVPKARWSQIEPANLLAWLPHFDDEAPLSPAQWQGVAAARYIARPQHELMARLLPLVPEEPGLLQEAALLTIETLPRDFYAVPSLRSLEGHCRAPLGPDQRAACLHAAELAWRTRREDWSDRYAAILQVRALNATSEGTWQAREREFDPAAAMQRLQAFVDAEQQTLEAAPACASLAHRRQCLTQLVESGDYGFLQGQRIQP